MNFAALNVHFFFDETPPRGFISTSQLTLQIDLFFGLFGELS